ncbi:hypothetical protein LTR85_010180 [Meristemomyces frigidus]|nr:hypothetical protein LTR85_010180 [Meristemomyces frigidus]
MSHQYAAATAAFSMLLILIVSFFRKQQYELFYVVHVLLVAVVLATVGYHTHQPPNISPRTLIIVGLAAGLWTLDRMLRLSTRVYHGAGNYCTLTPLPEGATKVTMHRPIKALPGSHVFLWIPGVRIFESHPFTLLANKPAAEFVIAAQDGFTKHLHEAACKQSPGRKFRAAIEGPYGTTAEVREFDKIVLLAGGSGATFTLALALHWARDAQLRKPRSTMEFVWIVKTKAYLHWFDAELAELQTCPAVNLRIHITGDGAGQEAVQKDARSAPTSAMGSTEQEKSMVQIAAPSSQQDFEKLGLFEYSRPVVDAIVERAVASVPSSKRLLVAAAGPNSILTDTRIAASSHMVAGLPGVHLHLEQFGW